MNMQSSPNQQFCYYSCGESIPRWELLQVDSSTCERVKIVLCGDQNKYTHIAHIFYTPSFASVKIMNDIGGTIQNIKQK